MGFVANYLRNLGRVWTGRQPARPLLFAESMQMRPRLRQYREFLHSVKPHG